MEGERASKSTSNLAIFMITVVSLVRHERVSDRKGVSQLFRLAMYPLTGARDGHLISDRLGSFYHREWKLLEALGVLDSVITIQGTL